MTTYVARATSLITITYPSTIIPVHMMYHQSLRVAVSYGITTINLPAYIYTSHRSSIVVNLSAITKTLFFDHWRLLAIDTSPPFIPTT